MTPGDQLRVVVRGEKVIVLERPNAYHAAIRGLARGVYSGTDLRKEQRSRD